MDKNNINEPILELNEFEEETGAILELAKKEVSKIIQEAKDKASQIIQEEKQNVQRLEKVYLEKTEDEICIEKERLQLKIKEELQLIETIPEARIKQAVRYILERIVPKGV